MRSAALLARMRRPAVARGFTLVELMVGMAIGMVLVLALVALIINVNRNNTELARTNSVIESGRFALQVLESDISHAGFWGGWLPNYDDLAFTTAPADSPDGFADPSVPDPCLATASWDSTYISKLIGIAVQPYAVPASGTPPVCTGAGQPFASVTLKGGTNATDMVVIRHVAPCAAVTSATDEDCRRETGQLYFQVDRCSTPPSYKLEAATAGSTPANFTLTKRPCGAADYSEIHRFVSNIYFVRDVNGVPTLSRSKFRLVSGTLKHDSVEDLVEGVEGFRIELGLDNVSKSGAALVSGPTGSFREEIAWQSSTALTTPTNRGDGAVDTYVHCGAASCSSFELMNAVTARIYVLARALTATPGHVDNKTYALGGGTLGPYNDGFKRHVYTRTVRLTNISMRREVPP